MSRDIHAESTIRRAMAIDPENPALHQTLAEILMQTDRNAERRTSPRVRESCSH
jgi:Flp pilus assembly protein TadD